MPTFRIEITPESIARLQEHMKAHDADLVAAARAAVAQTAAEIMRCAVAEAAAFVALAGMAVRYPEVCPFLLREATLRALLNPS